MPQEDESAQPPVSPGDNPALGLSYAAPPPRRPAVSKLAIAAMAVGLVSAFYPAILTLTLFGSVRAMWAERQLVAHLGAGGNILLADCALSALGIGLSIAAITRIANSRKMQRGIVLAGLGLLMSLSAPALFLWVLLHLAP